MEPAAKPPDEVERLAALYALEILDTGADGSIDRITRMARRIFRVPIALVSFLDDERQWVMSGFDAPIDLPRASSFCGYAILGPDVMVVSDTTKDARFADSPFVVAEPSIRFYAGAPLSFAGHRVGTICVLDQQPRTVSDDETELLKDLASSVESELGSARLAVIDELTELYNRRGFLRAAEQLFRLADRHHLPVTVFTFDLDGLKAVNDAEGHADGDELLRRAARHLTATFRASDVVARVGGDEFSVLVVGPCDVEAVGARLARRPEAPADPAPRLSTGWATREPGRPRPVVEVLAEADQRMYADKHRRRPTVGR